MAGGRERSGVAAKRPGKAAGAEGAGAPAGGRRGASQERAKQAVNGRSREDVPMERRRSADRPQEEGAAGHGMMDLEFLRGLIGAVDSSGIDSIEITRAGTRIRISKTPPSPGVPVPTIMASPVAVPGAAPAIPFQAHMHASQAAAGVHEVYAPSPAAPEAPPANDLLEINSPMVGTFYRSPAPEAPPYVEVGSHVTKGQTLCILEAMKLMNEVKAEVEGIVRAIHVGDAEPVEYGQLLFELEPVNGRPLDAV